MSEINAASFNEVKEDVFGFLDNKVMAPYMNMSSDLSRTWQTNNINSDFQNPNVCLNL